MKDVTERIAKAIEHDEAWNGYGDLIAFPPERAEVVEYYPDTSDEMLARLGEMISPYATRGAFYFRCREMGESRNMAEMLALQSRIGLDTDDVFFSESKPLYDQFGSQKHLDTFLKNAKQRGFTPPVNSVYYPGLARFQGDPEAFVTRAQGRAYIRDLCEKRGWACEGGVNVDAREPDSDPHKPGKMGEDIMQRYARSELRKNPDMSAKDRKELREKITAKHAQ